MYILIVFLLYTHTILFKQQLFTIILRNTNRYVHIFDW